MAQAIDVLIEGGKATAAPPLGPALGPLGVNIGQVISEINKKTESFKGMQVPVKVSVADDKSFTISIGTPPASALIKKEAGIEKGAGKPQEHLADLSIEQVIKIAKMKEDDLQGKTMKEKVKEVIGTCNSMGVMVEGKPGRLALREIEKGTFDAEIKSGKTEVTEEERRKLNEERKAMQEKLATMHAELDKKAQAILKEMEGKERAAIKHRLLEAGIPEDMVTKLLPVEAKGGAAKGGKPAAAAKPAAKPAGKK
jgi:large subunit ribosomal protein L11